MWVTERFLLMWIKQTGFCRCICIRQVSRKLQKSNVAGMDGPAYKGRKDPYEVLLVRRDGSTTVYQKYA
jgi:hypothetical protein